MELHIGWTEPVIVKGKRQLALLEFAMWYQGLHSEPLNYSDRRAMHSLVKKGLFAYYPATGQFRWHPVEPE